MKAVILAVLLASIANAQRPATSTYQTSIDGTIAHWAAGSEWKTFITLVNTDDTPGTYKITFYGDNGLPFVLQTTAGTSSTIEGSLGVNASRTIETLGVSAIPAQGWALVETSTAISGQVAYRQRVDGRPDYEASVPIITYLDSNHYLLAYDHFTSLTGLAIVNPSTFSNITVFLTFRNEDGGSYYLQSLTLGPLQHTAFSVSERYTATLNHRGVIDIETSGFALGILGLRFGADAAFTSLTPLAK